MAMAMLAVHEKVHQWACEEQEIGQYSEDVRPVFPQNVKQRAGCQANNCHRKDIFCAVGHRLPAYLEGHPRLTVPDTILLTAAMRNPTQAPKMSDQHKPCASAVEDVAGDVVNIAISECVAVRGVYAKSQHPKKRMAPTKAPTIVLRNIGFWLTTSEGVSSLDMICSFQEQIVGLKACQFHT